MKNKGPEVTLGQCAACIATITTIAVRSARLCSVFMEASYRAPSLGRYSGPPAASPRKASWTKRSVKSARCVASSCSALARRAGSAVRPVDAWIAHSLWYAAFFGLVPELRETSSPTFTAPPRASLA